MIYERRAGVKEKRKNIRRIDGRPPTGVCRTGAVALQKRIVDPENRTTRYATRVARRRGYDGRYPPTHTA
jgi:hypothetical protein